ncbi:MAG: hypothetical protein IIC52_04735 [Proteobacteria bacterium]|nr:hypothetical protein [Pseudomonadota bacterium]
MIQLLDSAGASLWSRGDIGAGTNLITIPPDANGVFIKVSALIRGTNVGSTYLFNQLEIYDITASGGATILLTDVGGNSFFGTATELGGFTVDSSTAVADGVVETYATKNDTNDQVKEVFGVADAAVLTIAVTGGGTSTFTLEDGTSGKASTIADLLTAINAADTALTATYNTTTSKVEVKADEGIAVDFSGTGFAALTLNDGTNNLASGVDVTYSKLGSETEVASLTTDFRSLLEQINALIGDASYKGTNLLRGGATLDVKFNVKGDSKLTGEASLAHLWGPRDFLKKTKFTVRLPFQFLVFAN